MIFPYKYQQANTKATGYVLCNSESIAGLFCACTESGISSLKTDDSKESGGIE